MPRRRRENSRSLKVPKIAGLTYDQSFSDADARVMDSVLFSSMGSIVLNGPPLNGGTPGSGLRGWPLVVHPPEQSAADRTCSLLYGLGEQPMQPTARQQCDVIREHRDDDLKVEPLPAIPIIAALDHRVEALTQDTCASHFSSWARRPRVLVSLRCRR